MARICPQCSQINQDETTFCRFCGSRFPDDDQAVSDDVTMRPASMAGLPSDADPSATFKSIRTNDQTIRTNDQAEMAPPQVAQPTPFLPPQPTPASEFAYPPPANAGGSTPAYQPSANLAGPSYQPPNTPNPAQFQGQQQFMFPQQQGQFMPPPQQGGYPPQQGAYPPPYGPQGAARTPGTGAAVLQRAFAGKGTPVHHQSWLLDGKQAQPATLRNSLIETLQKQGVMGVSASPERLREQGMMMEERDYVRIQYGVSSIFVYMAPMGQNLYVSRTSTVQQPFSRTRMVVLGSLLVILLLCWLLFALVHPSYSDVLAGTAGFAAGLNAFFGYAFYGLLFFFLYLLGRSFIFLLTDEDFLVYLRPNQLNDFTLDALSSVEKVTDKALRETLNQAGLDAENITVPEQSYPLQQALHRF